jgi:uncharacterized protein (TIGR03086 family)
VSDSFKPADRGAGTLAGMSDLRTNYTRKAERVAAVLAGATDWTAASPCEGWTAADVVDHLVDTQRDFLGRHVTLWPRPEGEPDAVWSEHVAAVLDRVGDDVLHAEYDGYFGGTTVGATLADFYGFDMLVHRWDLARALGREAPFTEAEMDDLDRSISTFGEAMYAEGICRRPVPVPASASRQDTLLGVLGRDPYA